MGRAFQEAFAFCELRLWEGAAEEWGFPSWLCVWKQAPVKLLFSCAPRACRAWLIRLWRWQDGEPGLRPLLLGAPRIFILVPRDPGQPASRPPHLCPGLWPLPGPGSTLTPGCGDSACPPSRLQGLFSLVLLVETVCSRLCGCIPRGLFLLSCSLDPLWPGTPGTSLPSIPCQTSLEALFHICPFPSTLHLPKPTL